MKLYPARTASYIITEWDSSRDKVKIVKVEENKVQMRYEDGVTHLVTPEYFVSLNPWPIR